MKQKTKISKQKMQEFKDEMEKFSYLRQSRVSYWQAIAIVFGTSAIILLIDLIVRENVILKLILIILLFFIANLAYRQSIRQTQKSIFVSENAIGTIEGEPKLIKGKDGQEYYVFRMSDFIRKGENEQTKNKIQTN